MLKGGEIDKIKTKSTLNRFLFYCLFLFLVLNDNPRIWKYFKKKTKLIPNKTKVKIKHFPPKREELLSP